MENRRLRGFINLVEASFIEFQVDRCIESGSAARCAEGLWPSGCEMKKLGYAHVSGIAPLIGGTLWPVRSWLYVSQSVIDINLAECQQ